MTTELKPCPFCGGEATYVMGLPGCEPGALVRRDEQSWNRRSFRAGIEAAARLHDRLSEWAYEAEEDPKCGQMHRDFAERIRALAPAAPEPTEAEVERVAERMAGRLYTAWDSLPDYTKGRYRELARAALAAVWRV